MLESGFVLFLQTTNANEFISLPYLFMVLFSIYLFSVWLARNRSPHNREALLVVLIFAVAFRLTLLFSGPVFSLDVFRYPWDGKVAASGMNPYVYRPNATELTALRDANWELVNHKELRTGYPPLMEMLFETLYLTFPSVMSYKIVFFLFDLATIATACFILKELKLDLTNAVVYAWAPLPIVEISQTGHNVSVAVFFVLLSFLLLLRNRNYSSASVMALAVATELYPVFFAPILLKRWGKWGTSIFLALILGFHIPYADVGLNIYSGLLYAINTSNFNGSVFPLIMNLVGVTDLTSNPGLTAEIAVYISYVLLLLWALWKSLSERIPPVELMKLTFLLTGAVLLLNRSLFAWYLIWIIPFLCFYSSVSWLLLSGTTFLSYIKYDTLPPPPFEGVTPLTALAIDLVQYMPFYVILAYELFKHRIRLRPHGVQASTRKMK